MAHTFTRRGFLIGTGALAAAPVLGTAAGIHLPAAASMGALDFSYTLGSLTELPGNIPVDGPPRFFYDGEHVWHITIGGPKKGTRGSPDQEWRWDVYRGTTIENLALLNSFWTKSDGQWPIPNGDDTYWPYGIWIDTDGTLYAPMHIEFNYGEATGTFSQNWFKRIGLAASSDNGATWELVGDIITSDNPTDSDSSYAGNYVNHGPSGLNFFFDANYFYIAWDSEWAKKLSAPATHFPAQAEPFPWQSTFRNAGIARAPLASKMAPGSWSKFLSGAWSSPGLGGHGSNIFPGHARHEAFFYNTYLDKYIMVGAGWLSDVPQSVLWVASSLETQDWSEPARINIPQGQSYRGAWDNDTMSSHITDSNFRFFRDSALIMVDPDLHYNNVTLSSGSTPTVTLDVRYPSEPVPDLGTPDLSGRTLYAASFDEMGTGSAPPGWDIVGIGPSQPTVQEIPSASDKSVLLYDNSPNTYSAMERLFPPQSETILVEFRFMMPALRDGSKFHLKSGPTLSEDGVYLDTRDGGHLGFVNSSGVGANIQPLSPNVWYSVRIYANPGSGKFDLYVDGERKLSAAEFRNPVSALDRIRFDSGVSAIDTRTYIDDVRINYRYYGPDYTFDTVNDAYVRGGSFAGTNFGTEIWLDHKTWPLDESFTRWSYLKFDLSDIEIDPTEVDSAILRLFGGMQTDNPPQPPVGIAVYAVADTGWSETGITWSNKPTPGAELDTITVEDTNPFGPLVVTTRSGRWYDLDVTNYVRSELAASRTTISLALKALDQSGPVIVFRPKESDMNKPHLFVAVQG